MKLIFSIFCIGLYAYGAMACDVCGCSASAYSMGIMRNYNSHFVAFRYNTASFHSQMDHNSSGGSLEHSNDLYQRYELMGRFSFSEKLKLIASVPYLENRMQEDTGTTKSSGLGDPSLLIQFRIFSKKTGARNQVLFLGGGPKFPLGKFDESKNGVLVNPNFQMGSGSFDFILNSNYLCQFDKQGFTAEASYKINTVNQTGYRFGNQFNTALNYFYATGKNSWSCLLYGGGTYERANPHYEDGERVFNTGSSVLSLNTGTQLYYKNFRLGAGFQYPLMQKFRTDNLTSIQAGPRFFADLVFFLN